MMQTNNPTELGYVSMRNEHGDLWLVAHKDHHEWSPDRAEASQVMFSTFDMLSDAPGINGLTFHNAATLPDDDPRPSEEETEALAEAEDTGPDLTHAILFADSNRGQYIPQYFAESVIRERVAGVKGEEYSTLLRGPDEEWYWETWESVSNNAVITMDDGTLGELYQGESGDLWVVPIPAERVESAKAMAASIENGEAERHGTAEQERAKALAAYPPMVLWLVGDRTHDLLCWATDTHEAVKLWRQHFDFGSTVYPTRGVVRVPVPEDFQAPRVIGWRELFPDLTSADNGPVSEVDSYDELARFKSLPKHTGPSPDNVDAWAVWVEGHLTGMRAPDQEWYNTAEELIDKAHRRGAISYPTAKALARRFGLGWEA